MIHHLVDDLRAEEKKAGFSYREKQIRKVRALMCVSTCAFLCVRARVRVRARARVRVCVCARLCIPNFDAGYSQGVA